jgi:hypothetical protein
MDGVLDCSTRSIFVWTIDASSVTNHQPPTPSFYDGVAASTEEKRLIEDMISAMQRATASNKLAGGAGGIRRDNPKMSRELLNSPLSLNFNPNTAKLYVNENTTPSPSTFPVFPVLDCASKYHSLMVCLCLIHLGCSLAI